MAAYISVQVLPSPILAPSIVASDWYKDIVFCGLYDLQGFGNAYKFYYTKEKRRKLPLAVEMEMAKKCFQIIMLSGEKLSTHKVIIFVMFKYLC